MEECYYCLCDSCVNNVENFKVKSNETPHNYEPCFCCDDCRVFDGDIAKRNMKRVKCDRYKIDNYHAEKNRKKFKIVKVID